MKNTQPNENGNSEWSDRIYYSIYFLQIKHETFSFSLSTLKLNETRLKQWSFLLRATKINQNKTFWQNKWVINLMLTLQQIGLSRAEVYQFQ